MLINKHPHVDADRKTTFVLFINSPQMYASNFHQFGPLGPIAGEVSQPLWEGTGVFHFHRRGGNQDAYSEFDSVLPFYLTCVPQR